MESHNICPFDWLISLSKVSSRFTSVTAHVRIPFLLKAQCYSIVHMYTLIHSSVYRHMGCFHLLAVGNSAMNVGVLT